jgi:hypothetical protein
MDNRRESIFYFVAFRNTSKPLLLRSALRCIGKHNPLEKKKKPTIYSL